ncbi:uncharacterized protein LOC132277607 [Cornus florida]|uniref:uncharacterized protein LOC132277607 n=1 Tax=Cornus florida TaxID=4283 RepID=UPI00289A3BEE|nr:uncharacterized protein LOC132277607 [Cornus florida]
MVKKLPLRRGGIPPLTTRGGGRRASGKSARGRRTQWVHQNESQEGWWFNNAVKGSGSAIGRGGRSVMQSRGGGSAMGRGYSSTMQSRGGGSAIGRDSGSAMQSRGGGSTMGRGGGSIVQRRGGGSAM